jgi:adenylosuccinate synthase
VLKNIYSAEEFRAEDVYREYMGYAERLNQYIADTDIEINNALDAGKKVLFEGAQGTLLDIDFGTYPFVTCSSATAGGVCTGLGVSPLRIGKVVGIVKAYTTRVGSGPFPAEIHGPEGEALRENGAEYGATTGRPRRCGWLDIVALRHSTRINGFSGLAITKLDVLDGLDTLNICTAYDYKGERLTEFPKEASILEDCKPVYESIPGWKGSTGGLTEFDALPGEAKAYMKAIEEMLGVEIHFISTGPKRNELIIIKDQF